MHDFRNEENSADKCGGVDRIDGIDPMRPNIAVRNDIATLADKSAAANYDVGGANGVERKQ